MLFSTVLVALLPIVGVLANPASKSDSCQSGPISINGRQCVRSCNYEFTSGSYKNNYQSCYDDCVKACAKDSKCLSAKWSKKTHKCYYNANPSPYFEKTSKGHGVKCAKPAPKIPTCDTNSRSCDGGCFCDFRVGAEGGACNAFAGDCSGLSSCNSDKDCPSGRACVDVGCNTGYSKGTCSSFTECLNNKGPRFYPGSRQ
ncbi:hypothetical protein CB0940_08245 [Cercospora beticola]|uniref:Apple domain-containing protein n=1 Tax=Cercospora beticola TaxID=122368 RepID=A0A2G5HQQ3_CERBT|nr:hypothetical protein CB0940_08245 [Cercospora beticola]PIA94855.1 hypothetical protein CB0940_08245 [Cercospora beticola]WPB04813.1 hypothetical protein RHO25_009460 [Cercospora beticola]CAK1364576.1 unnamed protein product [Cercospora beticola]